MLYMIDSRRTTFRIIIWRGLELGYRIYIKYRPMTRYYIAMNKNRGSNL